MQCFVLGMGGMMPMPRRRLASVAMRTAGWVYLFDCGEGTQVPYKELHLGQRALRLIAITHLHADHCLGLPGLLMLRAQMPDPGPLRIVGPPGLSRFINHVRDDLALYINYPIEVDEWTPARSGGLAYEDEHLRLSWTRLDHSVLCLGYRLEERDRPGKFDTTAADALAVPWGPLRGRLQAGESVTLPDGRVIAPAQVIGSPRRGRRLAYAIDTADTPALGPLLQNTDLAFVEGMFLDLHLEEAVEKKHLTVRQAASAAHRASVAELVLLHVSPRYEARELAELQEEASRFHPRARVARDGETIEVPLPD